LKRLKRRFPTHVVRYGLSWDNEPVIMVSANELLGFAVCKPILGRCHDG
jgi:hypothetical protein